MTQPEPTTTAAVTLTARRLRRVLIVLCTTEITSWGVLYYAFPVLAPHIHTATGWPLPALTAACRSANWSPPPWASRWAAYSIDTGPARS
ncbi:hypothetical protein [Actinocatenispora comari]|uniref:MFS transporter n=1 Tax=Actinocatenispora comari TaxID=2807577 RepID=A0A8J4AKB8_9ACTN|nr:hypothetical protein [Actinocatenispora comari]GIL30917.1 hypothetical protein NUM_61710 [Actinocatenispora comari]